MGLAQLTRSDSQALRELMDRNAVEQEDRLRDTIDERMSTLTLALSGAVERNMAQLTERVDAQLGSVAETVAQRAAEAADIAVASTFDQTLERLDASARLDRFDGGHARRDARLRPARRPRSGCASTWTIVSAALAKMIRSDNRVHRGARCRAAPASSQADRRETRQADAPRREGAPGRDGRGRGRVGGATVPVDVRAAPQGDAVHDRGDGQGRRGPGREDGPTVGSGGRRGRAATCRS